MKNITYLFGAGASYGALPLGNEIKDRLIAFKNFLSDKVGINGIYKNSNSVDFALHIEDIVDQLDKFNSIDDYARSLYLSYSDTSLKKLAEVKKVITLYFLFEQMLKPKSSKFFSDEGEIGTLPRLLKTFSKDIQRRIINSIDARYRKFVNIALNSKTKKIKDHINVISWNYDMQIELTYQELFEGIYLQRIQENLQIYPSRLVNINPNNPCILKLNGTAGLYDNNHLTYNMLEKNTTDIDEKLDSLLSIFDPKNKDYFNKLVFHFAWEDNQTIKKAREYAKSVITKTEELIIIGYSFPEYNRDIDQAILGNTNKIEKITYQASINEKDDLMDKLISINPAFQGKITFRDVSNEFYYSNELF